MPENIGSPANSCATPTVNGLQIPEAKPQPMASRLIPSPVNASHPKRIANATTIGTSGTHSSKEPMKAPIAMKKSVTKASSLYFSFPYRYVILSSMYFISPHFSRQLNTPPITSKKAITAMSDTLSSPPSTSTGDRAHFQNGIPPPGTINVNP